ncbi:hypothetical protein [Anaerotignum sp.]|uniref:hypothetical protein n=1 Tax=Anaerotignum sp. TaxID=2039241 RepID=UPI00289F87E9|nr:hypothetical protein [Anaerotignum sp.]
MFYAMIIGNTVIDVVVDDEKMPIWPPDPDGNEVVAVECDSAVFIGMLYVDGKFIQPVQLEPEPMPKYIPTKGELAIMETQATIYEELNASMLASAEATAEIYEAILLMGGNANG